MTTVLLVVNVVCFLVQSLVERSSTFPLYEYFALSKQGLRHGYLWQLLTFQFMHGGFLHLLFNSIAIFFFGRAIEETLGKLTFVKLYLLSGIFGGLFQILCAVVAPRYFDVPVVGASAGGFGLIAAYATLFPERTLTLLVFFIIPVNMRAKYLLLFSAAIAIFGIVYPSGNVAQGAHLGGMLLGIAYVKWFVMSDKPPIRWSPFGRTTSVRELVNVNSTKRPTWRRDKPPQLEDLPPAQFISQEVDPILDKISAHGIHSLTDQERQVLDAARKKMTKS